MLLGVAFFLGGLAMNASGALRSPQGTLDLHSHAGMWRSFLYIITVRCCVKVYNTGH
jgi:hypothetical protein